MRGLDLSHSLLIVPIFIIAWNSQALSSDQSSSEHLAPIFLKKEDVVEELSFQNGIATDKWIYVTLPDGWLCGSEKGETNPIRGRSKISWLCKSNKGGHTSVKIEREIGEGLGVAYKYLSDRGSVVEKDEKSRAIFASSILMKLEKSRLKFHNASFQGSSGWLETKKSERIGGLLTSRVIVGHLDDLVYIVTLSSFEGASAGELKALSSIASSLRLTHFSE
jgi:hypothetical protein